MQNTYEIQTYKDAATDRLLVMGIPKDVYDELVQLVGLKEEIQEIRKTVTQIFGQKELKKAAIAKLLNKSESTIDSWMYGNRAETNPMPLLVEGVHYRKSGARSILYNVENMKKFNPATAMAEKLKEQLAITQEKVHEFNKKIEKTEKRNKK